MEALERQGKTQSEIDEVLESQKVVIPDTIEEPEYTVSPTPAASAQPVDNYATIPLDFTQSEPTETAEELGLTEDDVRYLKLR